MQIQSDMLLVCWSSLQLGNNSGRLLLLHSLDIPLMTYTRETLPLHNIQRLSHCSMLLSLLAQHTSNRLFYDKFCRMHTRNTLSYAYRNYNLVAQYRVVQADWSHPHN